MNPQQTENRDPLTGLFKWSYGRILLEKAIAESRKNNRPLCLIFADIDGIQLFNDKYGHVVGDEAIKNLAHMIQNVAGENNIVFRIGGDEFVVIVQSNALEFSKKIAEQIRHKASQISMEFKGKSYPALTMTLGVVELQEQDAESLLKAADEAMYEGKKAGRNCVFPNTITPR